MNLLTKCRKFAVRALRVTAINAGVLDGNFFLLPAGLNEWAVKLKKPLPGGSQHWTRIRLRPGTADLATFVQIFIREDYDLKRLGRYPELESEYHGILRRGHRPLIVDCGANIGLASLYFSLCFPQALVVGIEPEPGNYRFAAHHAYPNITLHRAAVSNVDEVLSISNPDAAADAFRVEPARETTSDPVPGYSMNSIIAMAARDHANLEPFLAKIDIEGFEETVFSSNTDWISRFKVLVVELHDWMLPGRGSSRSFLQAVSREPRDFLYFGDIAFSVRNDPG